MDGRVMTKRLIVVSIDALVYEDLDHFKHLPCFSRFWNEGSRVNRVRTVYPSLTYPAHTSILTGVSSGRHTVINNEPFLPGQSPRPWFWFHDRVAVRDIHDVAKEAGLTTCSLFWPVTGNHRSVDYLIDEYWPQFKGDTLETAYKRAGCSDELYEAVVRKREDSFRAFDSAITDYASTEIACDIIRKYKPNLMTLHLTLVDSTRHDYGVFNNKVEEAAAKTEDFISMIFEACREAGTFDETNFVITSDHGQLCYTRKVNLNRLLAEEGFLKLDADGALSDWDAYVESACFSAHVYLKNPADKALYDRVEKLLDHWLNEHTYGIGKVYTAEEAKARFGLYGDFSFVIETDQTTVFSSKLSDPLWVQCPPDVPGYGRATHGHDPDVGPQPVFLAYGPAIRRGAVIPKADIRDEAPTFAAILGLDFPEAEGHPIRGLLKDTGI